jgi:Stigma-specific protein, Stig1
LGLPGFNAAASLYRSSIHYIPLGWTAPAVAPVAAFNIRAVGVALPSNGPVVSWGLPSCRPPQGELCGFASGPPYDFAYCCPSGYVCCNPSCLPGSSTCVGCCPKDNPQCCNQNGSVIPGPVNCPYPLTNCGLVRGPGGVNRSCCSPTEKCCNPLLHLCCGQSETCCGNTCCAPGSICLDSTTSTCCSPSKACGNKCCSSAEQCCGGACVDTGHDRWNCGTCGHACPLGGICENGVCTCPSGTTNCGSFCSSLNDPFNCGACGNVCPFGSTCQNGVCTCPFLLTMCGGRCTSLSSDSKNCGACGNVCPAGQVCSGGACVCPPGLTNCGGTCTSLLVDPKNCGACGRTCTFCCAGKCGANCNNGTCCQNGDGNPFPAACCADPTKCGVVVPVLGTVC